MAFDMGWNFRGTVGYVTDDSHYGVFVFGEAYPHTYTNGDGQSVNAGWGADESGFSFDRNSGNDPRLAGIIFCPNNTTKIFHVDLSSGSAPGSGPYTAEISIGDAASGQFNNVYVVKDGTTAFISQGPLNTSSQHFLDSAGTDLTNVTWPGSHEVLARTFATTDCYVEIGDGGTPGSGAESTCLTHFRLTLQAAGGATKFIQEHLGRGIGRGIFQGR